jgi:hypothetical protein
MAGVTRFPHYHQAENVVTNHVMVMLRTLYDVSPKLLEDLLKALCADDVIIGPRFSQQIAGAHSVPDGLIQQEPLAVFIETKLGSSINPDQLKRHCQTIVKRLPGRGGSFLISLTSGQPGQQDIPKEVLEMAHVNKITIVRTTFGELVTQMRELPVTDLALAQTLQEFDEFIFAQGLVPRQDQFLVAMLTGTSWRENVACGVYYEPVDRSPKWRRAAFLGLYHDKRISHVGRIVAVISAMQNGPGGIVFDEPEMGDITDSCEQAVREVIAAAQAYYPGLENLRHRFYLVDAFSPMDFCKATPGGMMGHRYFDIEDICNHPLPPGASGAVAAQALTRRSFR